MALNAVEVGVVLTLLMILSTTRAPWDYWTMPAVLAAIALLQFLYLTPALDLRCTAFCSVQHEQCNKTYAAS